MSGSDDGAFSSPARTPTGSMSPVRQRLLQDELERQNESMTRATAAGVALAKAQLQSDFNDSRAAFEESYRDQVQAEHLAEMEELRAQMLIMESNSDAQPQPPLSSRPTYSTNELPEAKTLSSVYDSKYVSNYARNN